MMSDPIADFLTRIRNASRAEHEKADIPSSKLKLRMAEGLKDDGVTKNFRVIDDNKQRVLRGYLSEASRSGVAVTMESNVLTVARSSDHRNVRALHGLTRSLVANMIHGVKDGFERKLEIVGIGYRCQLQGKALQLALGYSHPVISPLPDGIQLNV